MTISIDMEHMEKIGSNLERPEGVMVENDGTLWCSNGKGHCVRIGPDGTQNDVGNVGGEPNGLCMDRDGNVIIANIGNGQVQRLAPDGSHTVLAEAMDGKPMPSPNFPFVDTKGRIWVSNSTQLRRHFDATRFPIPDGSLALIENGKCREVASGIRFANGVTLDEKEEFVYVAETMARAVVRYPVLENGDVGRPEQYGPDLGEWGYPDGIAFDNAGNLWITLVVMNALAIITPDKHFQIVTTDMDKKFLINPTNITFGGKDLKTAYVGSLGSDWITSFEVPYGGMPLVHQMA
jgi:sugar lactone lactonase YvrE